MKKLTTLYEQYYKSWIGDATALAVCMVLMIFLICIQGYVLILPILVISVIFAVNRYHYHKKDIQLLKAEIGEAFGTPFYMVLAYFISIAFAVMAAFTTAHVFPMKLSEIQFMDTATYLICVGIFAPFSLIAFIAGVLGTKNYCQFKTMGYQRFCLSP